jgi:uncharacterized protein YjdB
VTAIPVSVTGVSLTPTASIVVGLSGTLTATITPSNATNQNLNWTSSNDGIASVSGGVVTAKTLGTATITVTTADGNHTATCAVTVTPVPVTSVTLNNSSTSIYAGNTETLSATVLPQNAGNKNVTWTSSDDAVAAVSSGGVVTAKIPGTATITATSAADATKYAACAVTVLAVPVSGVTVSSLTANMIPDETINLIAAVFPANATNKGISWTSNDSSVASVSSTGVVTAHAEGTATITATTADGGKTDECAIMVAAKAGLYHTEISGSNKIGNQNLTNALAYISLNAVTGQSYFIVLGADESVTQRNLSYSNKTVSITLMGDGSRTVQLSGNGSLFNVANGVTLTLDSGITLKGHSGNNNASGAALVRVNTGGTLTLKDNAVISGNTSASSNSYGGVYISGGTFIMEGGEISGNTVLGTNGAGVYVSTGGTFIMEGGEISGNTAVGHSGGGVHVSAGGTFIMEGGEISGNTAYFGGGVGIEQGYTISGTFIMEGGEISGNVAYSGGGVSVAGTFTKSGGTIYGDDNTTHSVASNENTATSGDGHAVWAGLKRNSTADSVVSLYASYNGNTWSYTDPATGGVGDTTAYWE